MTETCEGSLPIAEGSGSPATLTIVVAAVPTPIGRIYLAATRAALLAVQLPGNDCEARLNLRLARRFPLSARKHGVNFVLKKTATQLGEYFTGGRRTFSIRTFPVGTRFQRAVWQEVARIPFASTRSYADIARAIDEEHAVRAVGGAQKANPLPILVPCHRVIGSNGRLVGYEGGLKIKRWLLDHEQKTLNHGTPKRNTDGCDRDSADPYGTKPNGTISVPSPRIV